MDLCPCKFIHFYSLGLVTQANFNLIGVDFILSSTPPANDSHRFQEITDGHYTSADPHYQPADISAAPPHFFELSSSPLSISHTQNQVEEDDTTSTPPATSSTSSPASSSSSFEIGEFLTEPDLAMSRANWWNDLVVIYHPNREIGTKLVMNDIQHL